MRVKSDDATEGCSCAQKVLTVSVAAYNVEPYLDEALKSCVVPNRSLLEVIVVDDGSSDATAAVARRYVESYPDTFRLISKQNGGYGSTLNSALERAAGKYFRYLDGDDWMDSAALERCLNLLATCEEDAVFTPYTRHYEADNSDEVVNDLAGVPLGTVGLMGADFNSVIAGCSLAYKTDYLRSIAFRMVEHCFYTDALYAYIPMAFAKTLRVTDINVYRYRIGREGQSVSPKSIAAHHEDILRVAQELFSSVIDDNGRVREGVSCTPYAVRFLARSAASSCRYLCMVSPSKTMKEKLVNFDSFVRNYPEIYRASGSLSAYVRLLRCSNFALYRFVCWAMRRKARR